jgi:hypothetical protein
VCLPVHDAAVVQQHLQDWANKVMIETWKEHMNSASSDVKLVSL